MSSLLSYFKGFLSLFYPKVCVVCDSSLVGNEDLLCTLCRYSLPETGFHKSSGNPVEQLFWGRIELEFATSLLYFEKGSKYRNLIHQLKYQGRTDVGSFLGKLLGGALKQSVFKGPDVIVPVPLHRKKYNRRGYNQSEVIASAVARSLNLPVFPNYVKRITATDTQTRRKRFERWQNVENVFTCEELAELEGKHILLIDDVVTTGATLEAVARSITQRNATAKISFATLAFAYV